MVSEWQNTSSILDVNLMRSSSRDNLRFIYILYDPHEVCLSLDYCNVAFGEINIIVNATVIVIRGDV